MREAISVRGWNGFCDVLGGGAVLLVFGRMQAVWRCGVRVWEMSWQKLVRGRG